MGIHWLLQGSQLIRSEIRLKSQQKQQNCAEEHHSDISSATLLATCSTICHLTSHHQEHMYSLTTILVASISKITGFPYCTALGMPQQFPQLLDLHAPLQKKNNFLSISGVKSNGISSFLISINIAGLTPGVFLPLLNTPRKETTAMAYLAFHSRCCK